MYIVELSENEQPAKENGIKLVTKADLNVNGDTEEHNKRKKKKKNKNKNDLDLENVDIEAEEAEDTEEMENNSGRVQESKCKYYLNIVFMCIDKIIYFSSAWLFSIFGNPQQQKFRRVKRQSL